MMMMMIMMMMKYDNICGKMMQEDRGRKKNEGLPRLIQHRGAGNHLYAESDVGNLLRA
jgi:hypothetical protein